MEKIPIHKLLRAVHDKDFKNLSEFTIIIKHRGAKNDEKSIEGNEIESVEKSGFWYVNKFGKKVFIPAHRIIRVLEST